MPWHRDKCLSAEGTDRLTGQANGADKPDIDNVLVTETCSSKVDLVLSRNGYDVPKRGRREERHLRGEVVSRCYFTGCMVGNDTIRYCKKASRRSR